MKSKEVLDSFVSYCEQHPDERFWQALCNWSGQEQIQVVTTFKEGLHYEDTFYWENKSS